MKSLILILFSLVSLQSSEKLDSISNSALKEIELNSIDFNNNILSELECQYSKKDSVCPVCNQIDKIIPIVYGYLVMTEEEYQIMHSSNNQNEDLRTFVSGGCEVTDCDPNWYCKRDSVSY